MIESQRNSYHLVDQSRWPIPGSLGALAKTVGGIMYMHSFQWAATLLSLVLIFILYTMFIWWYDVQCESTLEGHHTKVVQLGPRYGFFSFLFGTLIPHSYGAAVTWAHHAILVGKEKCSVYALVPTILLALVFTGFQGMEYYQAPSTISDSTYGSTFLLPTGFHDFYVIIGTLFLIICGIRQYLGHLTKEHHVGFEVAAWYWHLVDMVRLFPFISIYWWGGI